MTRAPHVVRHLAVAQAFFVAASSVDLTLTGIVGATTAPTPALATLPFSLLFVAAGLTTFVASRCIGRFGHRATFVASGLVSALGGTVSAVAIADGCSRSSAWAPRSSARRTRPPATTAT